MLAAIGILAVAAGVLVGVYLHGMSQDGPDVSRTRKSTTGLFVATMAPVDAEIRQGAVQSWILTLKTRTGAPVDNAAVEISGGMPQHNHGLPTSPQVTAYMGEGRYRIDGLKFTMSGWWQLRLSIAAAAGSDSIVFNIVL